MNKLILYVLFFSIIPSALFSQESGCDDIKIHEYDKFNRLVKLTTYENEEMKFYKVYTYFKDTLLLKVTEYTPENKVISGQNYEYNSSDRNTRRELITYLTEQFDPDNFGKLKYRPFTENIIENYEYDSSGNIVFHQTYNVQLRTTKTEHYFYASGKLGKKIFYDTDGGYSDTSYYDYNGEGLLIKKSVNGKDSQYNYFDTYEYDISGRLVKENFHTMNSTVPTWYAIYKYGTSGELLSEELFDSNAKYRSGKTYEYNEKLLLYKSCEIFQSTEIKSK